MELVRGVCSLCPETTKVLPSADTGQFTKQLPKILYQGFLPESEFEKIQHLIKICAVCCYKIQLAVETQKLLNNEKEERTLSIDACYFCQADECLMKIERHWKHFIDRTQGYLNPIDLPVCACPKCLFYFDTIFNFKTRLLYKFPKLLAQKKSTNEATRERLHKESDTPKRKKSLSTSPPSSKKRKIFDNCFTYLQPLCNNNYHVDIELQRDKRLYKKIAYVDLTGSDFKETPKLRPIIKIKLKPSKKSEPRSFVNISKSAEVPRGERHKTKRRYSLVDKKESSEEPEEKIDETPKSASVSNLVPKRRVSVYMDNGDNDEEKETTAEAVLSEGKEIEDKQEETEISQEPDDAEPPLPPPESPKNEEIEENGIDKLNEVKLENIPTPELVTADDAVNGDTLENIVEDDENENKCEAKVKSDDDFSSDSLSSSSRKSPSKSESSEGSDSDTSNKDNSKDVLNGSERKKKRVTFSDEINN